MFKQPCFIRKNTPELRKKLNELGYKESHYNKVQYEYLCVGDSNADGYISFNHYPVTAENENVIDCGTNEQLFLALAALRDVGGYLQWYINDNTGEWVFCKCDRQFACRLDNDMLRKATPAELIEHFKTE